MKLTPDKSRIWALNGMLAVLAVCVVYSGFAYPLHYGRGLWPFNRDWFMFSSEGGYEYELQALGESQEGTVKTLDVSPYFQFGLARHGNRFQETPRDAASMQLLAKYLCHRFPVKSITINDLAWFRPAGRPPTRQEIDPSKITTTTWVDHYKCGL